MRISYQKTLYPEIRSAYTMLWESLDLYREPHRRGEILAKLRAQAHEIKLRKGPSKF